jgi:hypothetical protein
MQTINLSNNTYWFSLNSISSIPTTLLLPPSSNSINQIFTVKEASGRSNALCYISTSADDYIEGLTYRITLNTLESITLQCISTSYWSALNFYSNINYQTSIPPTGATIVNATQNNSLCLVDLRTTSKVVVLPNTYTTSSGNMLFTIKDNYGSASTNTLFLSTPSGMYFEGGNYLFSTIRLTSTFTSIDFMANLNRYSILQSYP